MRVEPFVPPVVGAYFASLTIPAAGFLTLVTGGTLPGSVTLAGAWVAVAIVGSLVAASVSGLADAVGTVEVGGVATLLPVTFLPALVSSPAASRPAILAAVGLTSGLIGLTAAILGRTVQNRRRRANATEWYSVTTGDGDNHPTLLWLVAVTVPAGALFVGGVVVGGFDVDITTTLLTTSGSLGLLGSLIGDDETSLAVTDDGVVVNGWLRGVETITGYTLDDEEFQLQRGGLLPTVSVDCAELDDDDRARLRTALDRLVRGDARANEGRGGTRDGSSATAERETRVDRDERT